MKTATEKSIISKVYGERFRFCNTGCADCYRGDRKLGIYSGCWKNPDGSLIGWAEGSRKLKRCAYCLTDL